MYCSSCGGVVTPGLSFCNHCGAKLHAIDERIIRSREVKPEALIWAMVAVLVFGFVGIVFLMMAMKMVRLNEGPIVAFTTFSFLIMLWLEAVFMWKLFRHKRSTEEIGDSGFSTEQDTKEFVEGKPRALPEPLPSVTEHTTRSFEPIYSERKSK